VTPDTEFSVGASFDDYAAVAAVLDAYLGGARAGDVGRLAGAFHPAATIHGRLRGELISGPTKLLFDAVAANPPRAVRGQVTDITVSGTAATARMELLDWNGVRYTDLFVLLKAPGGWQIVTKVFDAHADA
jgi:hypothetical protein